jgi:hypothetical protein
MATATHVVVRSFPGPGGPLTPGDEVAASDWRNTDSLVRRRYLRPIEKPPQVLTAPRPIQAVSTTAKKQKER